MVVIMVLMELHIALHMTVDVVAEQERRYGSNVYGTEHLDID